MTGRIPRPSLSRRRFLGPLAVPRRAAGAAAALWLWLATPGSAQLSFAATGPTSPLEVHQLLRSRLHGGHDVSGRIDAWTRRTGDHSFDGLRQASPLNRKALQRQLEALAHWDAGRLEAALEAYRDAARMAIGARDPTEALFCRYYIAEILAQRDLFDESLREIDEALRAANRDGSPKPYLEALLLQSRGYALWLMDYPQASIQAFAEAQRRWAGLRFPHGTAANWNNLASLHEDLGFAERAEACYRMALKTADEGVFPEIRLQIHANFALFLDQRGRRSEALRQFELARLWKSAKPFEFLLLRRRLFRDRDSERRLRRMENLSESENIERLLVLAETEKDDREAFKLFREAIRRGRGGAYRRWRRIGAVKMAARRERRGDIRQAAALYKEALREADFGTRPEFIFPYSRVVSAAFDGWIRCLVDLGRSDLAWFEIQKRLGRAARRARGFMDSPPTVPTPADDLERFLAAVKLDTEAPPARAEESPSFAPRLPRTDGRHSVLEMWPEGRRVFAWIANRGGFHFRVLTTDRPVSAMVAEAVDPLYQASDSLPPWPAASSLRRLHDQLILPVRDLLDSRNLLFVGRKELESLPIEMLRDRDGRYLLEAFDVSYLPRAVARRERPPPQQAPVAVLPRDMRPAGAERAFFREVFPEARRVDRLESLGDAKARWIHVSSHLDWDREFWIGSPLGPGGAESVAGILRPRLSCRLLSLGVCDVGNSHRWGAPYWLSLSELLLTREVDALLISRWKMDEFSSEIYLDFFRLSKTGLEMDRALGEARRAFLGRTLRRQGAAASGAHPFFWAGISYVGNPGLRLYPERDRPSLSAVGLALLAALAAIVHLLRPDRGARAGR